MADRAFSTEEEFFKASGMKDFSKVEEIDDDATPTGQFYKRRSNPAVFQNSAFDPNAAGNAQMARLAGQAGLGLEDLRGLIGSGLPEGAEDEIRSGLGIDALESNVFKPAPSTEKLFTDAYAAAGLSDVKKKLEDLASRRSTVKQELNERMLGVNENPWLSEASRLQNIGNTKNFFQGDLSALSEEEMTLQEIFNSGLSQVNDLVTRRTTDFANQQAIDQAQLNYLLQKADKEMAKRQALEASKVARYLPEYLSAKIGSTKPETITTPDGGIYQWDTTSGQFVEIKAAQPKLVQDSETGEWVNPFTGQPAGSSTAGYVGSFAKPGTLAERNNNPGNLRFIGQEGATPGQGGFAAFPTLEAGLQALQNDLTAKLTGKSRTGLNGNSTIQELMNVYAPKGDGNDPTTYANNLARELGVSTNTKIGTLMPRIGELTQAIAKFESGFTMQQQQPKLTKTQKADVAQLTDDIRVDPDIKDFIAIRDGFERIKTGVTLDNAQGDLALLFGYMRMLDPNSVVRETEFANAEAAMGYAQKVLNLPAKFFKGDRLTSEARTDFQKAADRLYDAKLVNYEKAYSQYEDRAKRSNVDPALVLRDFAVAPASVQEIITTARRRGQSDAEIIKDLTDSGMGFQHAVSLINQTP